MSIAKRFFNAKRQDSIASAVIRVGGVLVILTVVAIVANIGLQSLPLLGRAHTSDLGSFPTPTAPLLAGTGSRQEVVWQLDADGGISFPSHPQWTSIQPFGETAPIVAADAEIGGLITVADAVGRIAVGRVRLTDRWEGGERFTAARWRPAADVLEPGDASAWVGATANRDADGNLMVVAWSAGRSWAIHHWDAEDEEWSALDTPCNGPIAGASVAEELGAVSVIDGSGTLRVFNRSRLGRFSEIEIEGVADDVGKVRYLIGGGTLVAAAADGRIQILLTVPRVRVENTGQQTIRVVGETLEPGDSVVVPDDEIGHKLASVPDASLTRAPSILTVVRSLPKTTGRPTMIASSPRRRGFIIGTDEGRLALYHATSGRRLVNMRWSDSPIAAVTFSPKADGLVAVNDDSIIRRKINNPHPEVSLRTLFLPVWYEGYAGPKIVWQSTGGSDAFEPKFSLIPLIFGTLKATLYAMIISIPLALFAALYVSQLGPAWFRSFVKPTIELMAAVPSVVVGFLAALWLAPRLETALLTTITGVLVLPFAVLLALAIWRALPVPMKRRLEGAGELIVPLVAAAIVLTGVYFLIRPLEQALFGGDFNRWLFSAGGFRYDQRNSLVVGIALGFAVIPVIFTIAEDAFSSVPRTLVNASRALGATRWKTARHLVVPAATAGIFAAVILGLGRAVGETMIVLMAAGNTPLLDLSPFNGMRTMSAAIAVEIPEAPVDGTLFRVLFLTGFLLFCFTLVLTTIADQVGRVMRRKYGAQ